MRLDTSQVQTQRLIESASKRNASEAELVSFLIEGLGSIQFGGREGLKDRTGLMEFRYDAI